MQHVARIHHHSKSKALCEDWWSLFIIGIYYQPQYIIIYYIYTTTLGPLSLSSLLSSPVNKLTVQYKANYFGNAVNHVQKNNLYSHKEWNMSICKFKMKEKKRRYEKESDKIKLKSKKSHNELQRVRPQE